jgi:heterodisulfide reductase subunit B
MEQQTEAPTIFTSLYEKPIPDDDYYVTQSCVTGAFSPSTEPLITRIYDLLGRRWAIHGPDPQSQNTCCSGISTHGDVFTIESTLLTVGRLWSIAAGMGLENFTCACVTSFAIHSECLELLEHEPGLHEKVDRLLFEACGRRLVIPKNVVHCSDIVYHWRGELAKHMKYRLVDRETGRPLDVVDHVGCHYNKLFQQKSVGGAEYCDVLTGMIREWGGAEVDYPERRHCCGMGFRQCMIRPNRSFTMACARKKFESMGPYGPDLVLTNCPGCTKILDGEQWAVNEMTGSDFQIPVLNYAELVGLLLGWDPYDVVGIQGKIVPVEPLLDRIGIPQSASPAYARDDALTTVAGSR